MQCFVFLPKLKHKRLTYHNMHVALYAIKYRVLPLAIFYFWISTKPLLSSRVGAEPVSWRRPNATNQEHNPVKIWILLSPVKWKMLFLDNWLVELCHKLQYQKPVTKVKQNIWQMTSLFVLIFFVYELFTAHKQKWTEIYSIHSTWCIKEGRKSHSRQTTSFGSHTYNIVH